MKSKLLYLLRQIFPILIVFFIFSLVIAFQANADPNNLFTGCISKKGKLNNAQIGATPTSPCKSGDQQVSADYGDITSVVAGAGLSGGATQGDSTISISNGGVNNAMLADNAVTVAKLIDGAVTTSKIADEAVTASKINSGTATNGQVITANGSGGASWQSSTGGSETTAYYASFDPNRDNNGNFKDFNGNEGDVFQIISLNQLPIGNYIISITGNIQGIDNCSLDPNAFLPNSAIEAWNPTPNIVFTEGVVISQQRNLILYCSMSETGLIREDKVSMVALKVDTLNVTP